MKQEDIDWGCGHVTFWDLLGIDERVQLTAQVDELKEDLAQVAYPDGVLLDVGWYPEFSADGAFRVSVVRADDWDEPLFVERCQSVAQLKNALRTAVAVADAQGGAQA
jgi:hypothetical protein